MRETLTVRKTMTSAGLVLLSAILAACSGTAAPAITSPSPTAASPSNVASASPSADPCAKDSLKLTAAGKLTIGTDNPAFPPYFDPDPSDPAWELGNPKNGKGFESAVAYALADKLGFSKDEVNWVVVPFDNSFKPGPKAFDFDINQVSYTPERAQSVDMSDGYFTLTQSVVALKGTPAASATTITQLKGYTFGAQVGTTSLDTIVNAIKPDKAPSVYDTNDKAIQALKVNQIDAIVVDLPSAFYITAVQLDTSAVVGQFPPPTSGDAEHFSLILTKGSPLTACVNAAVGELKGDGTLDAITKEWLSDKVSAPVLQP